VLHLIDIDKLCQTLESVEPRVFVNDKFSATGLHSPTIFSTSEDRKFKLTYFDLRTEYINPFIVYLFQKHHKKIYEGLLGTPVLIDDKNVELSSEGISGIPLLKKIYEDKNIPIFDRIRKLLDRSEWNTLVTHNVLVLPPAFRQPYETTPSDLDALYMKLGAKRGRPFHEIQPEIQNLFESVLISLKGKGGFLRSFLLSRKVDFSARFVITVDPTLDLDHVYLPYRALAMLFAPTIIHTILQHPAEVGLQKRMKIFETSESIYKVLTQFYSKELPAEIETLLCQIIDKVIVDKVIVAKRDPVLHQGSIFAFYPLGSKGKLEDSHTMSISPLITDPFNADFDGDTMAVFVPQTIEGIADAKKLLPSTKRVSPGSGTPYPTIKQDYIVALYRLTKNQGNQPIETLVYPMNTDWYAFYKQHVNQMDEAVTIKHANKVFKSTYGRYIINSITNLPIFFNEPFNKKIASKWLEEFSNALSTEEYNEVFHKLNYLALDINGRKPITLDLTSLNIPPTILHPKELQSTTDLTKFATILDKTMVRVKAYIKEERPDIYDMIESGARGSWDDIRQLVVARGFVSDIQKYIAPTPIASNYLDGLNPNDIYASASGWRGGIADRTLNVAQSGYLTRQLVYTLMNTKLTTHDCKTTHGLKIKVTEENKNSILHRYLMPSLTVITNPDLYIGQEITIRSPIYCEAKDQGICSVCYGNLSTMSQIGIIAAQTLGERSTQLIMKTFHTGGLVKQLSLSLSKNIPKAISIDGVDLVATADCYLIIEDTDKIKYLENSMVVLKQVLIIKAQKDEMRWEIPYSIKLNKELTPALLQPHKIIYALQAGEKIGTFLLEAQGVQSSIATIISYLRSSHDIAPDQYLELLYQQYSSLANLPLVHLELLVSELARVREDTSILWRYKQNEPSTILSLKQAIATSPTLNMFFENIGRALENLVNSDEQASSDLETLIGVK